MELEEYKKELLEDLKVSAEYEMDDISTEFVRHVIDMLIEAEEFDDFIEGYFSQIGERNKKLIMDGYYFDDVDKSCVILISDFVNSLNDINLTATEIDKLYNSMRNLVEASLDGYILKNGFEESTIGYQFAKEVENKLATNNITKFRFYIITNKQLSQRVKNIKKEKIREIPVELNVWDINRLYAIYSSNLGKESIEIDFETLGYNGLNCVKATDTSEYSSYLAIIRGDILADLYLNYGSRLLEGNVRSFLSVKGKVNKNIRNTILNEASMFFAYNNGIAATATNISVELKNSQLCITKIKDLQIINGGQTTASIANAKVQDKVDLANIFVPMKLSVVEHEKAKEMIPTISRCANSQNKIDEADFFSNHPYHIRIEELSRKNYAPSTNGNQFGTIWFYERARGQYVQEQMKFTAAEKRKFQIKNPKNQLIKKVDLAKYINTFEMLPHIVSKGSQANMRCFAEKINKEWEKTDTIFNEYYYKKIIALAILFKETENLVSNQDWYKEIKAYRANIVTYSIAILSYKINELYKDKCLNFKRIWSTQKIYPELEKQLMRTTKQTLDFINSDDRLTLNVTEWCKKEICWERAKQSNFDLIDEFVATLIDKNAENEFAIEAKKEQKISNQLNTEIEVVNLGTEYWSMVLQFGQDAKVLTPMDINLLNLVIKGKVPNSKQAKFIMDIRKRLYEEGLPK